MKHYFTNNIDLKSELKIIKYNYKGFEFEFISDNGVFSKNKVDYGSKLLLESYLEDVKKEEKVLDVGCGYGYIGLVISKVNKSFVDMIDVNKRALHLSNRNAKKFDLKVNIFESDAYKNIKDNYDSIITNPPIRAGKEKVLEILEGAFKHLYKDGKLYFVIRKDQGALTIKKILEQKCKIELLIKEKGFLVFKAINKEV